MIEKYVYIQEPEGDNKYLTITENLAWLTTL